MTDRLQQLSDAGVSIWLDDLSRERLETGNLADLVEHSHVVGVTSNPSIFQAALSKGERYDAQIRELASVSTDRDQAVRVITTDDVRDACKVLRPVYDATDGWTVPLVVLLVLSAPLFVVGLYVGRPAHIEDQLRARETTAAVPPG